MNTTSENATEWRGDNWSILSPSWPGVEKIRYLVIFGDSYSETDPWGISLHPSVEEPLGIAFPGITMTDGGPNWVGHLVHKRQPPILVYNYAKSGHTIDGVKQQRLRFFKSSAQPSSSWSADESLFVTWVGINDLARSTDFEGMLEKLFTVQQGLYEDGARNFLFIDVPPIERSPAYRALTKAKGAKETRFIEWNKVLARKIREFAAAAGDPISALYFSSHKVFEDILNNPKSFGFPEKHVKKDGGDIWVDHLHPTSAVHAIVAAEMEKFLNSVHLEQTLQKVEEEK